MKEEYESKLVRHKGEGNAYVSNLTGKHREAKSEALEKHKEVSPKKKLEGFRKSLRHENISYGELAELGSKKYKKYLYNDPELAEASGMSEDEFRNHKK